jgi:L-malate glycosyltransferase
MNKVRVCQFATLSSLGGVERILIDLLSCSQNQQIEYYLVTTTYRSDLIKMVEDIGRDWFQPKGKFRYDPGKLISIARYMNSNHIDMIHSRNGYANSWANLSLLLMKEPARLITGEHGTAWAVQPPISWLDKLAHQRAHMVIANSKASALVLGERYKVASKKIRVVYNGIQMKQPVDSGVVRHKYNLPTDVELVGSVGRLDTVKDYRTFIDAAEIVLKTRKRTHFLLIGGGPQESFLRSLVEKKGIQNSFLMLGWRTDARSIISGLDLFVNTSIRESFGNTLVEATMLEKPVIAPAVDGIPEAVGDTGVLLPPTLPVRKVKTPGGSRYPRYVVREGRLQPPRSLDPYLLAESIIDLLNDPARREEMGKKGRERAFELFSIDRYKKDLENIYFEVCEW